MVIKELKQQIHTAFVQHFRQFAAARYAPFTTTDDPDDSQCFKTRLVNQEGINFDLSTQIRDTSQTDTIHTVKVHDLNFQLQSNGIDEMLNQLLTILLMVWLPVIEALTLIPKYKHSFSISGLAKKGNEWILTAVTDGGFFVTGRCVILRYNSNTMCVSLRENKKPFVYEFHVEESAWLERVTNQYKQYHNWRLMNYQSDAQSRRLDGILHALHGF